MFEAIFGYLTLDHLMAGAGGILLLHGGIAAKNVAAGTITHGKSLFAAAKALEAQAAKSAATDVSTVKAAVAAVAPVTPVASAPASASFEPQPAPVAGMVVNK